MGYTPMCFFRVIFVHTKYSATHSVLIEDQSPRISEEQSKSECLAALVPDTSFPFPAVAVIFLSSGLLNIFLIERVKQLDGRLVNAVGFRSNNSILTHGIYHETIEPRNGLT